ncbi:uncharacterized protein BO96DRAFT_430962 [Aspergillus niger CBS 101883]|uniref:uncharacterized protein n=1 Tax=Aspergillus lacticoffeatus (strain CBS 101883) TaxID=1450533 RepID=UPI000D7EF974|nr:uncharacterized protein BO96DRAFT_430962 [Aspergillus niger CBS 101883]PYH59856.1 hypothetical protein BO96DRAFT_430962 [Aspergillus niger CBS 101883]
MGGDKWRESWNVPKHSPKGRPTLAPTFRKDTNSKFRRGVRPDMLSRPLKYKSSRVISIGCLSSAFRAGNIMVKIAQTNISVLPDALLLGDHARKQHRFAVEA